jgi:hypothetical protein
MALWQISFLFLPKSIVGDCNELPRDVFESCQDDLSSAAPSFSLPSDYREAIARLLPRAKGWSNEMELWGDEKSDDICVWRDDGKLSSIQLRLDVRKLNDSLLEGVLVLARSMECLLVERRYRTVCNMDVQEFRSLICGHPHHRAMKDPAAWLPILADEVRRNEEKD